MKTPAHVVAWVTLAALIDIVTPRPASASCDLVPSSERRFPSTLGAVTTPFASPGDVVTVLREGPVFDADPAANQISVRSKSPGGPVATASALAPSDEEGSACTSRDCVTGRCSCLRFAFPDAPAPGDGSPLTGPVTIEVQTGGTRTAVIDSLLTPASRFADPLLPCFLALPRPNRFEEFLGRAADVRAARDTGGTLFIPLDYA